jgi:hypothetical protein
MNPQTTAPQEINTEGDTYGVTQYGDNIFNLLGKPEFDQPNLELFVSNDDFNDDFVQEIIGIIQQQRLLILGGDNDIDKTNLALYLAWYISCDGGRSVKRWQHNSEPQRIDVVLQEEEDKTVYIFNQVLPRNIGYYLDRIHDAAISKDHYVIITTDEHKSTWKFSEKEEENFWEELDLDNDNIYKLDCLVKTLVQRLNKEGELLRHALQINEEKSQFIKNMLGNLTFEEVARSLQVPNRISRFVSSLKDECESRTKLLNTTEVNNLIEKVKKDNRMAFLHQWYHILDENGQLFALGLNFFVGLLQKQFFAVIDNIVENIWRKKYIPSLQGFDTGDFKKHNLLYFFSLIPIKESDEKRIETQFSNQRLMLFKPAWEEHSQKILAALPIFENLITDSVKPDSASINADLYGTEKRRRQLRKMLREVLSDLVCISPMDITNKILRRLAVHSNEGVKIVAAYALARWRDSECGHDENRLVKTLKTWIEEIEKIKDKDDEKNEILATIAITVGYAAAYYVKRNQLDDELSGLFLKLSSYQDNRIRRQFFNRTLPMVVSQHIVPLRQRLLDMTQRLDLIQAISSSLAYAYQFQPKEVLKTLDLWKKNQSDLSQKGNASPLEKVLATVALTYGKIECDEKNLTASKTFEHLQTLFANTEKTHSFVRHAIIVAIGIRLFQKWEVVESQLLKNISDLEHERKLFVEILTLIYLNSSDEDKEVMREIMFRWAKDESEQIVLLAKQALVNFAFVLLDDTKKEFLKNEVRQVNNFFPPKETQFAPFSEENEKLINYIITWYKNGSPDTELPMIIWQHLIPLPDLLCHMMNDKFEFILAMSQIFAWRWSYHQRQQVLETLDLWKKRPSLYQTENSQCEYYLQATVALTYGKIKCDEKNGQLTVSEAFGYLQELFKGETSFLIRHAVIVAMGMRLHQNFDKLEPQLHELIIDITSYEDERETVVKILTYSFNPIIKNTMLRWVKDNNNRIAQEIAIQVLVRFQEHYLLEAELLHTPHNEKHVTSIENIFLYFKEKSPQENQKCQQPPYAFFEKVIPCLFAPWNKNNRKYLRHLLHETWKHYKKNQNVVNYMLSGWENGSDTQLKKLSNLLNRPIFFLKPFLFLLFVIISVFVFFLSN